MARGNTYSIIKRKRNGREIDTYQVRVLVPKAWQSSVGKKEALRSLGTGDLRVANQKAPKVVAALFAEWEGMKGRASLSEWTEPELDAALGTYENTLAALEAKRRAWPDDDVGYTARLEQSKADLRLLTRRLQNGDISRWEELADRMC